MDLTVRPEPHPDIAEIARLATEAFGPGVQPFAPDRMAWLYERAFSQGTTVLGLFAGSRKVGQVVLLGQRVNTGRDTEAAVALVDLFILPAFRSKEAIGTLYGAVEPLCRAQGIRFLLAVPNVRAIGVNRRLLQLETAATLDIRVGIASGLATRGVQASAAVDALSQSDGLALLAPFTPTTAVGVGWTAAALWQRLQEPSARYSLHATADVLLIAAPKWRRGLPLLVLFGLFARPGARIQPRDLRAVIAAAARLHRRPLFTYIGRNIHLPLPGWSVPGRFRPSVMIVQARDLATARPLAMERFELIDFDFA